MKKKLFNIVKLIVIYIIIIISLFETAYRFDWIDFYSSEIKALNNLQEDNKSSKQKLLIFGDSFSADQNSYIKYLRDSLPQYSIINSAVPGTSMFHHKRFLKRRINTFKPSTVIFQLYVGNDLIDYNHPVNWSENSFSRNVYWSISDYLISLQYLNYKLGQITTTDITTHDAKVDHEFSIETYNAREKLYYKADSNVLVNSINGTHKAMKDLTFDLNNVIKQLSKETQVYILIIPHVAQTSNKKRNQIESLGATLDENTHSLSYGFLNQVKKELIRGTIISPLDLFQKNSNFYYPNDPHLNPDGQKALANYILKTIHLN